MARTPLPPRLQRQAVLIKGVLFGLLGIIFVSLALANTGTARLICGFFGALDVAWALWVTRSLWVRR